MSDPSGSRLSFDFHYRPGGQPASGQNVQAARFLLVADLSGRANRGVQEPLAGRKLWAVDADNLATAPGRCGAALHLPAAAPRSPAAANSSTAPLQFESLEDFHPDALLRRVPRLAALWSARRALDSPATAPEAAATVQRLLASALPPPDAAVAPPAAPPAPNAPAGAASESPEETLARLLGKTPSATPAPPRAGFDAQAFIRQVLASSSSVVPATPAAVTGLISAAELELANQLRAVLHDPAFRRLEAAWRSAEFLVRRCPDEERIALFLLDATPEELRADPAGWQRLLREQRWALLVADCTFGATPEDLGWLRTLAATCAELGCGLLAGAHPQLVGCDSFAAHPDPDDWTVAPPPDLRAAWEQLRRAPEARHVGLALPRFLLRQPYGAGSDPIASLAFEEVLQPTQPESYLWGNSAVLCAQLLAEALAATDAESAFAGAGEVGELPVFRFTREGERVTQPCAEAWLSDRAADVILGHGLIPVLSLKGRDAVRVVNLRSIAEPPRALVIGR